MGKSRYLGISLHANYGRHVEEFPIPRQACQVERCMVSGMSTSRVAYKWDQSEQRSWTHTVPVGGQGWGEGSSVADREVTHLFPSLPHMEVPATCSQHSSALSGSQRTHSLQEEKKPQ